jgi:pimeloyl-ACP methyl ester carboxylesterase
MTARVEILGRYVDVGGVETYYESAGAGQPIVCVHTAGRDCRQWHAFLERYGKTYRILALDLPGHQKSSPLPGNRCVEDWRQLTSFLWAFCDAVGAQRPIIMGCSLGGNLALAMAQERPDDVAGVIALEGADTGSPQVDFSLLDHPAVNVIDWFSERQDALFGERSSPEARDRLRWSLRQATPEVLLADLRMYQHLDVRSGAEKVSCPCLLLRGTQDWIVPRDAVVATAERLTGASAVRVVDLPGLGHFPHQENPDACFSVIDGFLEEAMS